MYDVANFTKPVPFDPERSGEYLHGEGQSLEFFRHERNHSFVAELVREDLSHNP